MLTRYNGYSRYLLSMDNAIRCLNYERVKAGLVTLSPICREEHLNEKRLKAEILFFYAIEGLGDRGLEHTP